MTLKSLLKSMLNRRDVATAPRADEIIRVNSLLVGSPEEAVVMPMLPGAGNRESEVEFAAAHVLERVALGALVRRERARRIFEIGTFRGITAMTMASNAPSDGILWTLDLPPELSPEQIATRYYANNPTSGFHQLVAAGAARDVGMALGNYAGACRIEQLYGDASKFDFAPYVPIDLFFVDGCHEYEAALRDTRTAWGCLRPGGLAVWHDYTWEPVQRAVRDAALGVPITWIHQTSLALARKP